MRSVGKIIILRAGGGRSERKTWRLESER